MFKCNNKTKFFILYIIYGVFGVASAALGIWFFVQVTEFVSLRNSNHYRFDYRVYWPQVAPWLFILLGLFILFIAICGWCGTIKKSREILRVYGLFLVIIIIVLQVIAATLILLFADGEYTDTFVKDIVYKGYIESRSNPEVFKSFGRMEQKLRCCGVNDAGDYRKWRKDLPLTCCLDSNQATCKFTDKEAKKRLGCAEMASLYAKNMINAFVVVSFLIFLLGIIGLTLAWKYIKW